MFRLRCAARLRKRLGTTEETSSAPSSTRLGDWYAHLLFTRPQVVLCVSDRTFLPVVIAARDSRVLVPRLREAVGQMLRALGVAEAVVAAEQGGDDGCGHRENREPTSPRLAERLREDARLVSRGRNAL